MSAAKKALDALSKTCACHDCERTAVNLAPSLAAIAQAAMDRPWWLRTNADEYSFECTHCGKDEEHDKTCPYAAIDAAIDALEAAAKDVTP